MGLKHYALYIISLLLFITSACNSPKSKSDSDIVFTQDTLNVGYTYWWDDSGPFIGYCGEEKYTLVFTGTLNYLENPTNVAGPLYTAQKGIIELENVFKIKDPESNAYDNQKFFVSDCFAGLGLSVGDQVLVFCYEYEGDFCISGKRSIIKIDGVDHPLVTSTKAYIDADQNPMKIIKDTTLWSAYGFGDELVQHIRCRENSESTIIP